MMSYLLLFWDLYMRKTKREILISMTPYDKRIAIMENGELSELVVEGLESKRVLGNIYKGVVQKVLPGLKAAFIDIGMEKAGFLHQDDAVDRDTALRAEFGDDDEEGERVELPSIDQSLKEGQEIMVQVIKEPISTKGARLTTHLSFAGRFLVCMPGTKFIGVSKKERDPGRRRLMKQMVRRNRGENVGYIVRTNGLQMSEDEIIKQMEALETKWQVTQANFESSAPEELIYQESDSVETTIREYFSENTDFVYIDDKDEYRAMRAYLQILSPRMVNRVKLWSSRQSLFDYFNIEEDYERILHKKVPLPRGGYLVIEQTEALVSIDVNTGPKVHGKDQAKNILETNMDACWEISKQLRLRDIGGLVVLDFIDMDSEEDRDKIAQEFKKAIRKDKAPISFLPLSQFGLMEVTRKRVRGNILTEKTHQCPTCSGRGYIYTLEACLGQVERWLARCAKQGVHKHVTMVVNPQIVDVLLEDFGAFFHYFEHKYDLKLEVVEYDGENPGRFFMFDSKSKEEITDMYSFGV
jgi:ribonuclease G